MSNPCKHKYIKQGPNLPYYAMNYSFRTTKTEICMRCQWWRKLSDGVKSCWRKPPIK